MKEKNKKKFKNIIRKYQYNLREYIIMYIRPKSKLSK